MKTNMNMSVGIFKNTLIYILLEDNDKKRCEMMDKFCMAIEKYIIPIKPGRKNQRNNNPKNRYPIPIMGTILDIILNSDFVLPLIKIATIKAMIMPMYIFFILYPSYMLVAIVLD